MDSKESKNFERIARLAILLFCYIGSEIIFMPKVYIKVALYKMYLESSFKFG